MSKFGNPPLSKAAIYSTIGVTVASVCSFLEILPHSFFIDKYREIIAKYKRGIEVPLNPDIEKLFNQVLDDLKIKSRLRSTYKPFTITGFDTYYAGVNDTRFGVIIGIPGHFTYKDKRFVDILDIRVGYDRQPLNPYEPVTDELIESFVLSEKAKKFAIAREVLMSTKNLPLIRSLESPILICTTSVMADVLRKQYKIFEKPFIIAISAYVGLGLMTFATWFQIRDGLNTYYEQKVDRELAELGPDYVEGGKEFYDKLLKKNMAIRKLLGAQGRKQYNSLGDEIFFIRKKRTPLTQRKKFFEDYKITELPGGDALAA